MCRTVVLWCDILLLEGYLAEEQREKDTAKFANSDFKEIVHTIFVDVSHA